jgi:hypothetical protein
MSIYASAKKEAAIFSDRIKGLGFRVFLADEGKGHYGFITDEEGTRVLSFSFMHETSLSGNYGPPSTKSGTGWRMATKPEDLRAADDVKSALYAEAPYRENKGWRYYITLDQHLSSYGKSSKYLEILD